MPLFLLNMLKSKSTYVILIVVAALGYHYWTVDTLEDTIEDQSIVIEKQKVKISAVRLNFHTCTENFKESVEVNKNNEGIITKCLGHTKELSDDYAKIVKTKNSIINKLRKEIADLNEPVIYPGEIVYKECIVKVKGAKDAKIDTTFNSLNNIGR